MIPVVLPNYSRIDVSFVRGEGVRIFTEDGRSFLDFGAGVAVNALGHAHPHLVAELTAQVQKLWHCSNLYRVAGQEKAAERLVANSFADTVFFCNSGAEALEGLIKMTRKYHSSGNQPQRSTIICAEHAFHGRTMATITAGGQEKHTKGFEPLLDGFQHVPFGDVEAMAQAIGPNTAAILVEPIQGEGGLATPPRGYLKALRKLADENGILLCLDEVQTGNGRTGKFYAYEWDGITPDILATAKGLGGGFPVGAILATENAARGMNAGSHGSTFGGNPLAMAAVNATLDVLLEPGFFDRVVAMGEVLAKTLDELVVAYPKILEERRGFGLMQGVKCRLPNNEMQDALFKNGLLVIGAGENVLRFVPPLIVTEAEISDAKNIMDKTFSSLMV